MNKEIYEKILFVDKILNATVNPRSYRYFRDIKKYILECDDKNENLQKEIERLNNIISELERYINEEYIYDELGMKIFDASKLQDKLQELKGSDK